VTAVPRVLICDQGEVIVLLTVEAAARFLEPWALEEELVVVDEDGFGYSATTDGTKVRLHRDAPVEVGWICDLLDAGNADLSSAIDAYLRRHPKQLAR
jgi:hypothetical protein